MKDYTDDLLTDAIKHISRVGLKFDAENLKSKWVGESKISKVVDKNPKPNKKVIPETLVSLTVGADKRGHVITLKQAEVLQKTNPLILKQIKRHQFRMIEPESE